MENAGANNLLKEDCLTSLVNVNGLTTFDHVQLPYNKFIFSSDIYQKNKKFQPCYVVLKILFFFLVTILN